MEPKIINFKEEFSPINIGDLVKVRDTSSIYIGQKYQEGCLYPYEIPSRYNPLIIYLKPKGIIEEEIIELHSNAKSDIEGIEIKFCSTSYNRIINKKDEKFDLYYKLLKESNLIK
jgi:hypothetical protein